MTTETALPITCVCVMSYRGEPSTDRLDVAQLADELGEEKAAEIVEPILRGEVAHNYDADGEGDYLFAYYCIPEARETLRAQAVAAELPGFAAAVPADCEFAQLDQNEWRCTTHDVVMVGPEPVFCSVWHAANDRLAR